jgi:hypothetical protein
MTGTTDVPSIYAENNVGSLAQIRVFGTSAGGTLFGVTRAGWSSIDTNNGLGLLFGTTDNAPIVFGTNNTERFRIASGGAATFTSSVTSNSMKIEATSAPAFLYFNNTSAPASNYIALGSASNDLYFQVNGSDRMIITSSGRVGIGTTSPNTLLHVLGSGTVSRFESTSSNSAITISHTANGGLIGYSNQGATGNLFYVTTGSGVIGGGIVMDNNGNVGIGTASPTGRLTIQRSGNGAETDIDFLNEAGAGPKAKIRFGGTNEELSFWTGGTATERMRISSGGNVGIATTPSSDNRLQIFGSDSTSSNFAITLQNSSAAVLFRVRNDGNILTGLAAGSPYNNTSASSANVVVFTDGSLGRSTSSLKYKNNVRDYDKGLDIINQMRPVYYNGKNDGDTKFAGLIAEEIHALGLTEFVQYAKDGSPDALAYSNMIALLVKGMKELKQELDTLKNK